MGADSGDGIPSPLGATFVLITAAVVLFWVFVMKPESKKCDGVMVRECKMVTKYEHKTDSSKDVLEERCEKVCKTEYKKPE